MSNTTAALEFLRQSHDPTPVDRIKQIFGGSHERTYEALVALEAMGEARPVFRSPEYGRVLPLGWQAIKDSAQRGEA